jgi:hypothetical protein
MWRTKTYKNDPHLVSYPYGVMEDVLVRVNDLVFPTDFMILDLVEDEKLHVLLGRPFLATGRALIDVERGELMLRFQNEQVIFNIFEAMKHRNENPQCYRVDVVEEIVEDVKKEENPIPPMERVLINSIESYEKDGEVEIEDCVRQLAACEQQRDVLPKETLNQIRDEE